MSGLKATSSGEIQTRNALLGYWWYEKYEADKVIAELEKKLDLYKRGWKESDKINANLYAQLRHHKYKRCLAMAKICENKLGTVVKPGWWDKWRRRWLELAEKFRDNEAK